MVRPSHPPQGGAFSKFVRSERERLICFRVLNVLPANISPALTILQEGAGVTDLSSTGSALDRIISERATAKILGISPETLRRLNLRGEGPTRRKLSPRRVGYKISEVEAYRDGEPQRA
jgi:predicted DNA-binding transcriptional regulator AlpA